MNVAIVGSRDFNDYEKLCDVVLSVISVVKIKTIISGGARGADRCAEKFARERELQLRVLLPDKTMANNSRYAKRNQQIVQHCDFLIAFWDGKSPGSKMTIDMTISAGKRCYVYCFADDKLIVHNYSKPLSCYVDSTKQTDIGQFFGTKKRKLDE